MENTLFIDTYKDEFPKLSNCHTGLPEGTRIVCTTPHQSTIVDPLEPHGFWCFNPFISLLSQALGPGELGRKKGSRKSVWASSWGERTMSPWTTLYIRWGMVKVRKESMILVHLKYLNFVSGEYCGTLWSLWLSPMVYCVPINTSWSYTIMILWLRIPVGQSPVSRGLSHSSN